MRNRIYFEEGKKLDLLVLDDLEYKPLFSMG